MSTLRRLELTAIMLLATAGTAAAQGQQPRQGGMGPMRGMRGFAQTLGLYNVLKDDQAITDLNLNASQKTKITALTAAFQKDNAKDLAEMEKLSEEMAALRSGGRPDRDAMMAVMDRYRGPQENLGAATMKLQKDVDEVLTPAQREQLQVKTESQRGPRRRP